MMHGQKKHQSRKE